MSGEQILFYVLAAVASISAFVVIFLSNPIYSALFLALTMSMLGVLFFMLEAYFVAAAQIIVYAGAVMVLFVMVLMLFDLRHDREEVLHVSPMSVVKLLSSALLCGFLIGTGWLAVSSISASNPSAVVAPDTRPEDLAKGPLPQKEAAAAATAEDEDTATEAKTDKAKTGETKTGEEKLVETKSENPDEDLTSAEANSLVEGSKQNLKENSTAPNDKEEFGSTVALSRILFSKYVFAFEVVSLLLLVAIVGSVALARSKGGTHNVSR